MSVLGISRPREWPRLRFGGAATFVAGTLLAAGAIHICAILLIPMLAKSDGWSRLTPFAGEDRFTEIAASGGVAGLDPLFVTGACRIDLSDAPASITVDARERFSWSVALYDPSGVIVFSLNDRTALEGRLDMIVADAAQNAKLKQNPSEEIEQTIVVESSSDDLIALLRLFAPTRTAQEDARAIMARAECVPAPSVMPVSASDGYSVRCGVSFRPACAWFRRQARGTVVIFDANARKDHDLAAGVLSVSRPAQAASRKGQDLSHLFSVFSPDLPIWPDDG